MKFIINRELLLPPLQQVVNVIDKKQTMPILSNILLVVDNKSLVLTTTDLEIQLISTIKINPDKVGEITIPAKKFLDIIRLLPQSAEIKIELIGNKIKVSSGRSRFSLSTLEAKNYPEFLELELKNKFSINVGQIKKALDKTVFCIANQDVRYYLNGLLLHISNSKLKLVSSDGHRLAIYEEVLEQATGYEEKIILPRKGVLELNRLLDDEEMELAIQFSSSNIRILFNNLVFSAKLIDAKYPDFSKVFSQSFLGKINIQKQLFKEALTRVAILANEKFKGITCEISENLLKLSSHNPEHDEAEEELIIEYKGDNLTIDFNSQYLQEAVNNIDSEIAVISIASNSSTCFIEESEKKPYQFIVMAMEL